MSTSVVRLTMYEPPVVVWREPQAAEPIGLVVALHGRGADEFSLAPLMSPLPEDLAVVSVRAPIPEGAGWAWFENLGVGRPVPESLTLTIEWFNDWLNQQLSVPTYLLGFSGGMAAAGGLLLDNPSRFAGAALLSGTLPFDAGLAVEDGHLAGKQIFHGHGADDEVIPLDLVTRTTDYLNGPSGALVDEHLYDGLGHSVSPGELEDLVDWFEYCFQL